MRSYLSHRRRLRKGNPELAQPLKCTITGTGPFCLPAVSSSVVSVFMASVKAHSRKEEAGNGTATSSCVSEARDRLSSYL